MKLTVKYFLLTFIIRSKFFYLSVALRPEDTKKFDHGIKMQNS